MRVTQITSVAEGYREFFKSIKSSQLQVIENEVQLDNTPIPIHNYNALYRALTLFSVSEQDEGYIQLRYGLRTGEAQTFANIADSEGFSAEYIRKRVHSSIRKISHPLNIHRTVDYLHRGFIQ